MPVNHGIFQKLPTDRKTGEILNADQTAVFRYGIWSIFEATRAGPFLQAHSDKMKAAQLQYHFVQVCRRFVFSLQDLNGLMQRMAYAYSTKSLSPLLMELDFEAGCQADHVFSYLGTLVDDIAIAVALATGVTASPEIDSMGSLKHPSVKKQTAADPVRSLLDALDAPGSWWELAFKPRQGARQLLIHNQYLVTFNGTCPHGGKFEAQATLMTPSAVNPLAGDFFQILREALLKLCDWLDGLQSAMIGFLAAKSSAWSPPPKSPFFLLPVGFPLSDTRYHAAYFPIPLCDGSDPLPWDLGGLVYRAGQ